MPKEGGVPKNLKPFKKGHDERRNLKGRPTVKPLLDAIADANGGSLDIPIEEAVSSLQALIKKKNITAIQYFFDRIYGKATQNLDVKTDGEPIRIPNIIIPPERPDSES